MNKFWPFDKGIHLRVFLKGIESSVIIVFSILTYELIKNFITDEILKKNKNIPIDYNEVIRRTVHIVAIFIAEIVLVYLLLLLFKTEF